MKNRTAGKAHGVALGASQRERLGWGEERGREAGRDGGLVVVDSVSVRGGVERIGVGGSLDVLGMVCEMVDKGAGVAELWLVWDGGLALSEVACNGAGRL